MAAADIRNVLRIFDNSSIAPARQAVTMLKEVTKQISLDPVKFDLTKDPSDAEAWLEAGGNSYCESIDFTEKVGEAWLKLVSKPEFLKQGSFDKDEIQELSDDLTFWAGALAKHELELGNLEEIQEQLAQLKELAPEAEDSDDDDSDDE